MAAGLPACGATAREPRSRRSASPTPEALQQPADCGAAPLYLFVPHVFASGIGSQLRTVANSMMQARAAPHPPRQTTAR